MNALFGLLGALATLQAAPNLPGEVRSHMWPDGIPLVYEGLETGGGPPHVAHLYAVPDAPARDGRPPSRAALQDRSDVPMVLDVFVSRNDRFVPAGSVAFKGHGDVRLNNTVQWLRPKARKGPVIRLRSGVSDATDYVLVIFPDGFGGKAVVEQRFGAGGDQTNHEETTFDRVDERGNMMIVKRVTEGNQEVTSYYRWDGARFRLSKTARHMVKGAR